MLSQNEVWTLIEAYGLDLRGCRSADGSGGKPAVQKILARLEYLVEYLSDAEKPAEKPPGEYGPKGIRLVQG